ncbi:AMP-binding protein [Phytohabitans houttuyneae]|uniref:Acetyl-CoA synthetase n=1 Tax=Phytohabitans houttuyneae TaxID=1076126 RepID=A0A6V8K003_9ACTN|nr:AMP-binding protein [Phytohabitans houttuyneae]GFJ76850.1 acetyl-CoA synthetase [Phytohabitans houttuyneae]
MTRPSVSAHVDTFCRDRLPDAALWPELPSDLAYPERLNCARSLLDDTVAAFGPDRVCLRTPTETWTYGDLLRRANQVARVLVEDFDLVPGNRVLLRGPNTPWLVAAWFGVLKAGCVAVTTMPLLRDRELTMLAGLTQPSLALCDHRFMDDLLACDAPGMRVLGYGASTGDDLLARCADRDGDFTAVDTAADDVALLAPTSGTTGRPKITMHFHRDVLANADTFSRHVLQPEPDDVFTGTPPLGFTFGLGGLVVFPMRVGASTLLLEKATPPELADAAAAHGATVLFTAPAAYRAMLAAGKAPALSRLRKCVSAGEHLPKSVWDEVYRQTGIRVIDGIGSTEMLHIFIASSGDDIRPGATGRAVPGYRAKIVDAAGAPVPDGVAGLLAVQGPTGCRYLDDQRQHEYVRDGWNLTGDVFVRDADGYYWFQARADDIIVASGYKIAGPEVEAVLLEHAGVREAAVVGVPHAERGTVVKAFVVPADPAAAGEELAGELRALVRASIAPYKCPREIEFVAALPRTTTGKVQRAVLRDSAAYAMVR